MKTTQQLRNLVENLKEDSVYFPSGNNFHSINLKILTNDIVDYDNIHDWVRCKNMTSYLIKSITQILLNLPISEEVRNELILLNL